MKKLATILTVATLSLFMAVIWIGCSDDSDRVTSASKRYDVEDYFSLGSSLTMLYKVERTSLNDTVTYQYSAGPGVASGGRIYYPWDVTNVDYPSQSETGYLFKDGDAVYFVPTFSSLPEKILEEPFEVGHTWLRYDISSFPGNNGDDNGGGSGGGSDNDNAKGGSNDGGIASKSYPTSGSNQCIIGAIEDLELGSGFTFKDCIRVDNYSNGAVNYFWYAPDYGLVKYSLGVSLSLSGSWSVAGEFTQISEQ